MKGIRSFLKHTGFYKRYIKDFSKISKPLYNLLIKENQFYSDEKYKKAFLLLKEKLMITLIVMVLDYELLFKLLCDGSDYAIGALLR